jgi:hypothetical protein
MSIALEWLAVVLAGLAGTPEPKTDGPQITYQFQVIEVRGLQWREAAGHGLKPVTSRGGVTVWTAPRDFFTTLPEGTTKEIVAAPRVTAFAQAPAHVAIRKNHPFVTQVAWRGEGAAPRETTETVREGLTTTIAGRGIDQGVLARLVIEDTDIRSVHTLNLNSPAQASTTSARAADAETKKAGLHAEGAEVCCADDEANAAHCHGAQAGSCPGEKGTWTPTRSAQVQVPEIGRAEISGEWLIPRDEILLVGFGPHTVADKDGKAVVRERLALISAEEVAPPTALNGSETPELPRALRRVAVTAPKLAIPAIPSRSLPQGVHLDGTPAELPPLPDDEKADTSAGDSSEPRPSPQSKKPQPGTAPAAKPSASADNNAARTAFELAKGLFKPNTLPQFAFPNLQFVMPLKPFAMKLPFSQKLELELIGRVVPDTEAASEAPSTDQ